MQVALLADLKIKTRPGAAFGLLVLLMFATIKQNADNARQANQLVISASSARAVEQGRGFAVVALALLS